jgi:membrane protein implicated in regulation of membrane protease activity
MGLAYVFALIVGMGILTVQALLGSKDVDGEGFDKDVDFHADGEFDADMDADADLDADMEGEFDDAGAESVHVEGEHAHDSGGLGGIVALFLSIRFWVFASLGFGLSGTLLHYLTDVGSLPTAATAFTMGLVSGLAAALTFRTLRRTASQQSQHTSSAVGRVARVIVPLDEATTGKVRIELRGQSVDLIAKTTGLRIERGDRVLIEEVEGEVATVSRAPDELQE